LAGFPRTPSSPNRERNNVSLNISPQEVRYTGSAAFNDAFNDAQFVRTFGIIVLIGSFLGFVGGAIAIGLGVAVLGFGSGRYFKVLGGSVAALGALSIVLKPIAVLGSLVLACGIAWKALGIRRVLQREGLGDPDWQTANNRALVGLITSGIGILISLAYALLIILTLLLQATGRLP
jgi:hypothetical protein